jgi:phosphoribosylamine--glycine ligase
MKILVIDPSALALDFCLRSMAEGAQVRWFIRNKPDGLITVGDHLVQKVQHWEQHMNWADLVFLPDNAVYMADLDKWRQRGYPIYGANSFTAQWELNRQVGMDVLKAHGVPLIEGETFTSYDKAIAYVKANMGRYVSKPFGDADRSLSYVSKGPADMVYMLEKWKKTGKHVPAFIMQKFQPGIEMAVGAWVGPAGFASPWCENFEHKKLMNDDKGPNTGEMGTVVTYTEKSKLADKVLKPLEDYLVRSGHIGFVDVAVIIDDKGNPWPLEFTMRPGWPIFNIQQQLHRSTAKWMLESLNGSSIWTNFLSGLAATGVVLAIPDFPYNKLSRKEVSGTPIYNLDAVSSHIHPCELKAAKVPVERGNKIVEEMHLVSAGAYLLIAAAAAPTVDASREQAYKALDSLSVPNSPIYRTDIGKRLSSQLPKLQKMGYATSLKL